MTYDIGLLERFFINLARETDATLQLSCKRMRLRQVNSALIHRYAT
jgi:hypothetical protein